MIIRANLVSPDIHILAGTPELFNERLFEISDMLSSNQSLYFLEDQYMFNRLLECINRVKEKTEEDCPVIFDSWSCFNATAAGIFQSEPCPDLPLMKFSSDRLAMKYCDTDGAWWVHPHANRTWSNYTQCD